MALMAYPHWRQVVPNLPPGDKLLLAMSPCPGAHFVELQKLFADGRESIVIPLMTDVRSAVSQQQLRFSLYIGQMTHACQ